MLLLSLFEFPVNLFTLYERPLSFVDLYVTQANITFDDFRVRDAELVVQGFVMLQQHARLKGLGTVNEWGDFLLDMLFKTK